MTDFPNLARCVPLLLVTLLLARSTAIADCEPFVRGDADGNGTFDNVVDSQQLRLYLESGLILQDTPPFLDRLDANDNEYVNFTDYQAMVCLPTLPAPWPTPGEDPSNSFNGYDPELPDAGYTLDLQCDNAFGAEIRFNIVATAPVGVGSVAYIGGTLEFSSDLEFDTDLGVSPELGKVFRQEGNRLIVHVFDPASNCSSIDEILPGTIAQVVFDVPGENVDCNNWQDHIRWVPDPKQGPVQPRATISHGFVDHFPTLIPTPPLEFIRGDLDCSGEVTQQDAAQLYDILTREGFLSSPRDRADVNDNESRNLTDYVYLLASLACPAGVPLIPAPGPAVPGVDPTDTDGGYFPAPGNENSNYEIVAELLDLYGTPTIEIRITAPPGESLDVVAGTLEFDSALSNPVFTTTLPGFSAITSVCGNRVSFAAYRNADLCEPTLTEPDALVIGTIEFEHDLSLDCDSMNAPFTWVLPTVPETPTLMQATIATNYEDHYPVQLELGCPEDGPFVRGDLTGPGGGPDDEVNATGLEDAIYLLQYVLGQGPPPPAPFDRADVNDNEYVNFTDYQLLFAYNGIVPCTGAPPIPEPYPDPGQDLTTTMRNFDPQNPNPGYELELVCQGETSNLITLGIHARAPVADNRVAYIAGTVEFSPALDLPSDPDVCFSPTAGITTYTFERVGNRVSFNLFVDPNDIFDPADDAHCDVNRLTVNQQVATLCFVVTNGSVTCTNQGSSSWTNHVSWVADPNNNSTPVPTPVGAFVPRLMRPAISHDYTDYFPFLIPAADGIQVFIRGDVDGSGAVTTADIEALESYLTTEGPILEDLERDRADVNDDEYVNVTDLQLLKAALNLPDACPGASIPQPFPTPGLDETTSVGDFDPSLPNPEYELRAVVSQVTDDQVFVEIRLTTPVGMVNVAHVAGTLRMSPALAQSLVGIPSLEPVVFVPVGRIFQVDDEVSFQLFADPAEDCDIERLVAGDEIVVATLGFSHNGGVACDGSPLLEWVEEPVGPPLTRATIASAFQDHAPEPIVMDCGGTVFNRGDVNGDGMNDDVSDVIFLLDFGFVPGSPEPPCLESADVNGDGVIEPLSDAIYLLTHLFADGPPPPHPYPDCGVDPAGDLGCLAPACP